MDTESYGSVLNLLQTTSRKAVSMEQRITSQPKIFYMYAWSSQNMLIHI